MSQQSSQRVSNRLAETLDPCKRLGLRSVVVFRSMPLVHHCACKKKRKLINALMNSSIFCAGVTSALLTSVASQPIIVSCNVICELPVKQNVPLSLESAFL